MKQHKLFGIFLAAAILGSACGCQEKETSTLPTTYKVDGVDVTALSVEDETDVTEKSSEVYTYDGLDDAGAAAQKYVSELTNEENGFVVVDENFVQTQQPDYTSEENQVLLAKSLEEGSGQEEETSDVSSSAESDATESEATESSAQDAGEGESTQDQGEELLTIKVAWTPGQCNVTVGTAHGTIQLAQEGEAIEPMSENEMVDYFNSLTPAELGLSGDSMKEYEVYAIGGNVLVDGHPCIKLQVYNRDDPGDTNQFEGMYLMSSGGEYIYRVDMNTGKATQLSIPLQQTCQQTT